MKKILNYILVTSLCLGMVIGFNSCDYLEAEEYLNEVDNLNEIWTSRKDIRKNWAACYAHIPEFGIINYEWPFSGCGDEGLAGMEKYPATTFGRGQVTPDNIPWQMNYWKRYYQAIRVCNLFLENSGRANDRLLVEGEVEGYQNDVYFLRAFYYSLLLELYGPFVIIDKTIDYSSSDLPTTRATFDECVDFIVAELDKIIDKMPDQADIIDKELGRPSKGTAMAVKARVLLWAASPLCNGNNDYASFTNEQGTALFNQTSDINKWKKAVDAYKAIIDLNQYELFTLPANDDYKTVALGDFDGNDVPWPNGPAGIDPYRSYKALFGGGDYYWNKEAIWQISKGGQNTRLTGMGWPRGHKLSSTPDAYTMNAVQEMVDAYEMNNGNSIDEENHKLYNDLSVASTIDNFYILGDQSSDASPIVTNYIAGKGVQAVPNRCLNREPRFYATIGFQGRGYPQDDKSKPYYFIDLRAETADGYLQTEAPSCLTGYPIVKWINDEDNRAGGNFEKQFPVFRLAEVYLSYAEALNETDPGNTDILKYLNMIRWRAGLPGYSSGTQEEVREYIKHERFVEFAFEGKRHFDLRRWKDATNTARDNWGNTLGLGGAVHGCNYTASDGDFYDRYVVDGFIFKFRHYWLPIPYGEVANHWGSLLQNPGW
ncbi:RagB/SusD family nutrient uptake outer membrane protein [Puteibacter caeruleilacunae]|nr:RagB/SusD family nutrient uptake outer membrane protein [Puteibacter caeruleilacunae]